MGAGIALLWTPALLLSLQGLWMGIFFFTGWSMVTGSSLSFHIHDGRI